MQWVADPSYGEHEASRSELVTLLKFVIVAAIVIGGYLAWHTYVYRNCLFPPNIFDWPGSCL